MATTSLNPNLAAQPQSETQPSNSRVDTLCWTFNEAINREILPMFLQSNDGHEQRELSMFLSQVDKLHNSNSLHGSGTSILNYIRRILEAVPETEEIAPPVGALTRSKAFDSLPEVPIKLQNVTENIATEIASKVIQNVDSHNITMSLLYMLQQYQWETKVALTVTTYILTFGDFGLNLCARSMVTLNNISEFVKQLLEITSIIVEFEKLSKHYMTSSYSKIKDARTNFVVAIYWIIRAVVVNSTSHIMTISSRYHKFGTAISPPSDEKLDQINDHLKSILHKIQELLEDEFDSEEYEKIKAIVEKEDHNDNMEVLYALFSPNDDDSPQLFHGSTGEMVHLKLLKGKYTLLFIARLTEEDVYQTHRHLSTIDGVQIEHKGNLNSELLVIPIIEPSDRNAIQGLKSLLKHSYMVEDQRIIKNETVKLFEDCWNFTGEPIIVVLDPQGNVVNQNALPMIFIWGDQAYPFTSTKEEELWSKETLSLNLLVRDFYHPLVNHWIKEENYIFVYGGINIEWIQNFTAMVDSVVLAQPISSSLVKKLYVGKCNNERRVKRVCSFIEQRNLSHFFQDFEITWLFWKRIESMIYIMTQHNNIVNSVMFLLIQMLHNYEKSNNEWAILAKGSKIYVIGHGNVVLSTLKEHNSWQEKASEDGFENAFKDHYMALHFFRDTLLQRFEFPTTALKDLDTLYKKTMDCRVCGCSMKQYISYICDHSRLHLWLNI